MMTFLGIRYIYVDHTDFLTGMHGTRDKGRDKTVQDEERP